MTSDSVFACVARHKRQAEFARAAEVPGHRVGAAKDWAKSFSSRPGSADWRASCICGWGPKTTYYGEVEAMAAAGRHLRKVGAQQ